VSVNTEVPKITVPQVRAFGDSVDLSSNRASFPVSSSYASPIAINQIVKLNGSNVELAGAGDSVLGIVINVGLSTQVPRDNFLPASTGGYVEVLPFSKDGTGCDFELLLSEDGVGGATALASGFADILQTIDNTTENVKFRRPQANVQLDSSTAAGSAGSLSFSFRVEGSMINAISTAGTDCRQYLIRPVAAKIQTP